VLEPLRDVADSFGELARYGIPRTAGGSGVMRFIQNEQSAGPEFTENVAQAGRVGLVRQEAVRNDEARACAPRIGCEAPCSPYLGDALAIDDGEGETEF
jgi:hypothetical protein